MPDGGNWGQDNSEAFSGLTYHHPADRRRKIWWGGDLKSIQMSDRTFQMAFCLKSKSRDAIIEQVKKVESSLVVGCFCILSLSLDMLCRDFWIFETMLSRPTKQPIYWCIWQEVPSSLKMKKQVCQKYFMPDDSKHDAHGKIQLFCR